MSNSDIHGVTDEKFNGPLIDEVWKEITGKPLVTECHDIPDVVFPDERIFVDIKGTLKASRPSVVITEK